MPISRRSLIGGAAAAAVAGGFAATTTHSRGASADTGATLPVTVVNSTGTGTLWCYVSGIDSSGSPVFLRADGRTTYAPPSPGAPNTPLGDEIAIPVTGRTELTVPHLAGARIWFSAGNRLKFFVNPGPALVMPSIANSDDPNQETAWDFCELTYNPDQLYSNISCVDFASLAISLSMGSQRVGGLKPNALASMADGLRTQAAKDGMPWDKLIVRNQAGQLLRIVAPQLSGADFSGYFEPYVDKVWKRYSTTDLTIDTQAAAGKVTGCIQGDRLVFDGIGSFGRPGTAAIFDCSSAPFVAENNTMGAVTARLAAAFNRSTLLQDTTCPSTTAFYSEEITNHYARLIHEVEQDGMGYAFPYDDVHTTQGVDVEGKIQSANPSELTITVGNPT